MLTHAFADVLPKFQTAQTIMQTNQIVFTQVKPLKEGLQVTITDVMNRTCYKSCTCTEPCKLAEFYERFEWSREQAKILRFIEDSLYTNFNPDTYWDTTMKPILEFIKEE